jgi:hypothetical protein
MTVHIYYYQYNLYIMYDLYMFIRYLVSKAQVFKDTKFGLDNWYECAKLLFLLLNKETSGPYTNKPLLKTDFSQRKEYLAIAQGFAGSISAQYKHL